jgi:dihydroflavonol-4-reductase
LEWVAINPGLVLGPVLDKDSSASVQIVAKLLKGELPGLPRIGYAVVDVRDIADLEVRAMTAPQAAGQRYIGSGPFVSMSDVARVLKDRLGDKAKKVPTRKLPDWLVRFVGLFDSEVRGQLFELGKAATFKRKSGEGAWLVISALRRDDRGHSDQPGGRRRVELNRASRCAPVVAGCS